MLCSRGPRRIGPRSPQRGGSNTIRRSFFFRRASHEQTSSRHDRQRFRPRLVPHREPERLGIATIHARRRHQERRRRCRRGRDEREGCRSRRVGHRRDDGPADEVREDRRDRRAGPLPHPRSPESEVRGVGPRLWARRFAQGVRDARAGPQPESRGRAHARRSGAVLPGGVLVCDAEDPGACASSRKASETRRRSRNGSTS